MIESYFYLCETLFNLNLTGLQGNVMKESMQIAKTLAWNLTSSSNKKSTLDKIKKTLMAPKLLKKLKNKNSEINALKFKEINKKIKEYQKFIKNNFEYVGENFAYEARNIHYNNKKKKKLLHKNQNSM